MQLRKYLLILLLISASTGKSFAQAGHPPFWEDVQAFKKQDSLQPPANGQILFIGSSSFTKWTDAQQDFPAHRILNRAFGGSSLPDLIRFAGDIIYLYRPKQIVIYCGDNDLAASDTVTASLVAQRFRTLFHMIRKKLPGVSIAFVSIKPSPSRSHLMPKMQSANDMIRAFLQTQRRTAYIDVYNKMLQDGQPMKDIFLEDNLHMNRKGYLIWQKAIEPHLLK